MVAWRGCLMHCQTRMCVWWLVWTLYAWRCMHQCWHVLVESRLMDVFRGCLTCLDTCLNTQLFMVSNVRTCTSQASYKIYIITMQSTCICYFGRPLSIFLCIFPYFSAFYVSTLNTPSLGLSKTLKHSTYTHNHLPPTSYPIPISYTELSWATHTHSSTHLCWPSTHDTTQGTHTSLNCQRCKTPEILEF